MNTGDVCAVCGKPIQFGEWFIDVPDPVNGPLWWVVRHLKCEPKT